MIERLLVAICMFAISIIVWVTAIGLLVILIAAGFSGCQFRRWLSWRRQCLAVRT